MKRLHLQPIKRSNQRAAARYRTSFFGKALNNTQLNTLKQEGHNNLLALARTSEDPKMLDDHQKAAILSFNCHVLLLLYRGALSRKDRAFIEEEQKLLNDLTQKLARHDNPTRREKRFLANLTNKRGRGTEEWLREGLRWLGEVESL